MLPRLVNDGTRNRRPEVVTEIRDINGAVDQFLRLVGKTGPLYGKGRSLTSAVDHSFN